jgi:hypothetical protein
VKDFLEVPLLELDEEDALALTALVPSKFWQ